MFERELIPLTAYDQEPAGMTEADARAFWDTHAITQEYLASAPHASLQRMTFRQFALKDRMAGRNCRPR